MNLLLMVIHICTFLFSGVSNVKALADVIKWQRVDYDFQWHPIPVYTNVNVLVFSEGESLLPVSAWVFLNFYLKTQNNHSDF